MLMEQQGDDRCDNVVCHVTGMTMWFAICDSCEVEHNSARYGDCTVLGTCDTGEGTRGTRAYSDVFFKHLSNLLFK